MKYTLSSDFDLLLLKLNKPSIRLEALSYEYSMQSISISIIEDEVNLLEIMTAAI